MSGIFAQFAEGGGPVHSGHHDVEQNGVGIVFGGAHQALGSGTGDGHFPARDGFKAECGYFADIIFIVNDQNAVTT